MRLCHAPLSEGRQTAGVRKRLERRARPGSRAGRRQTREVIGGERAGGDPSERPPSELAVDSEFRVRSAHLKMAIGRITAPGVSTVTASENARSRLGTEASVTDRTRAGFVCSRSK